MIEKIKFNIKFISSLILTYMFADIVLSTYIHNIFKAIKIVEEKTNE